MKAKSIKLFVVNDVTFVSFIYKDRNYLLTCTSIPCIDSEESGVDFLVCVHIVNSSITCKGTVDFLFSVKYIDYNFDYKKNIKSLVDSICIHIDLPF